MGHVLERLIACSLALLLLRSAFAHLGNPYYFLSSVYAYEITGDRIGKGVALVLPFLQMVIAFNLLTRWWLIETYCLGLLMFLGFIGVQAFSMQRGLEISCGCFGASGSLHIGFSTLLVTGIAALAALTGLCCTIIQDRMEAHAK